MTFFERVLHMNDNFKCIYKILSTLESAMDYSDFDISQIDHNKLEISEYQRGKNDTGYYRRYKNQM